MASEAIVFQLPGGKHVVLDMARIMTMPSENGEVSFTYRDGPKTLGPFRVGKTHIQYIVGENEVVEAITTIPLEAVDGSND